MDTPEVNAKNISAILGHSNETRRRLKEVVVCQEELNVLVGIMNKRIESLLGQVQKIQVKIYSGGSTS